MKDHGGKRSPSLQQLLLHTTMLHYYKHLVQCGTCRLVINFIVSGNLRDSRVNYEKNENKHSMKITHYTVHVCLSWLWSTGSMASVSELLHVHVGNWSSKLFAVKIANG